jgi:hypothetical protein
MTTKAQINQLALDHVKPKLPSDKATLLQGFIEAMNEMVNLIEHSGRVPTTKDFYGDYLPLVRTRNDAMGYILAGAGPGVKAAMMLNGI